MCVWSVVFATLLRIRKFCICYCCCYYCFLRCHSIRIFESMQISNTYHFFYSVFINLFALRILSHFYFFYCKFNFISANIVYVCVRVCVRNSICCCLRLRSIVCDDIWFIDTVAMCPGHAAVAVQFIANVTPSRKPHTKENSEEKKKQNKKNEIKSFSRDYRR